MTDAVIGRVPASSVLPSVGAVIVAVNVALLVGVTTTLSNAAVHNIPSTWLLKARPTYTVPPSATVVVPTVVQAVPFVDCAAVTVLPLRVNRTQSGAPPLTGVYVVSAPSLGRCSNATP